MTDVFVPKAKQISIRQDAGRVLLIVDGQLVLDMTWQQCLELGRALTFQARKAEEIVKVDQVVMDQALLMRAGIPLRLATHDTIVTEAGKEAAWNSDLRRAIPNNIDQYGILYTPIVTKDKPD